MQTPPLSGAPLGKIDKEASRSEGVAACCRGRMINGNLASEGVAAELATQTGAYDSNFKKSGRMTLSFAV